MSDETKNKPALEDNFAELEDILKQMEQPEISLEQSFLLYQSGVEKLKECNVMLDTVEKKMQILNAKGELFVNKTPIYVLPRKNICNRNNIYCYGALHILAFSLQTIPPRTHRHLSGFHTPREERDV